MLWATRATAQNLRDTGVLGAVVGSEFWGSSGVAGVTGTLAVATPGPTATVTASVGFAGSLALMIPAPVVAVAGGVTVSGALSVAVPAPTFAASGSIGAAGITGTLDLTVPGPTFALSGAVIVSGSASVATPAPSMAGSGAVLSRGTLALTVPSPTASGSGSVTVSGALALSTPSPVFAASGSIGAAALTGTLDAVTPEPSFAGSGSVSVTGTLAGTIPAPAFEALGAILTPVVGIMNATLDAPVFAAHGTSTAVVECGGGGGMPNRLRRDPIPAIIGDLVASLPAPVVQVFGDVHHIQIDSAIPSNTRQTSIVLQESSIEAVPLAPHTPITLHIHAAIPAPSIALIGSVTHESALAVALDSPTFAALGEVGEAYDDSEDLMIALMMLEAA